jgi:heme-degrading monooxygenase HmoA
LYLTRVIPELQKMPGCLYVGLVKSDLHSDEGISMSIWDSQEHAEDFAKSGLFEQYLEGIRPYLADSSEWKMQLSKDLTLEYQPVTEEPVLKAYTSIVEADTKMPAENQLSSMYLRILSLRIQPGLVDEFEKIYKEDVFPILSRVKGCRYAFMTESTQEKNEALSLTIWDSKQDAMDFETSPLFDELVGKLGYTFSGLFQWKMELEERGKKVVTSADLRSKYYTIVTGKAFD